MLTAVWDSILLSLSRFAFQLFQIVVSVTEMEDVKLATAKTGRVEVCRAVPYCLFWKPSAHCAKTNQQDLKSDHGTELILPRLKAYKL